VAGSVLKDTKGSCALSLKSLNMGYTIMGDKYGGACHVEIQPQTVVIPYCKIAYMK